MNPRSGGGKVTRFGLKDKAEALGADVAMLEGPGQHRTDRRGPDAIDALIAGPADAFEFHPIGLEHVDDELLEALRWQAMQSREQFAAPVVVLVVEIGGFLNIRAVGGRGLALPCGPNLAIEFA
jgi:hypothetical protein